MADQLIGVLIGGALTLLGGILGPLVTHRFEAERWKRQARLDYLKSERMRLEEFYIHALRRFREALLDDHYEADLIAEFYVVMPNELTDFFEEWMHKPRPFSEQDAREASLNASVLMKRQVAKMDDEIRKSLDAPLTRK